MEALQLLFISYYAGFFLLQPLIAETEFTKVTVRKNKPPINQSDKTITTWRQDSESSKSALSEPPIKTIVYIKTGGTSLGFSLCGGRGSRGGDMGILVRNIDPNGLAGQDGRLKKGDEILEVNSQHLKGCTHKEAASIIRVSIIIGYVQSVFA